MARNEDVERRKAMQHVPRYFSDETFMSPLRASFYAST